MIYRSVNESQLVADTNEKKKTTLKIEMKQLK